MNYQMQIIELENELNQLKAETQLRRIDAEQRMNHLKEENRQLKLSAPELAIISAKVKREARKWKRYGIDVFVSSIKRDCIAIAKISELNDKIDELRTETQRVYRELGRNDTAIGNWKDRYLAQIRINEMMARMSVNGTGARLSELPPSYEQ